MVDKGEACLSSGTLYRIKYEEKLVYLWKRRRKRKREDWKNVSKLNERWGTGLMYLGIGSRSYYLVTFMNEYSCYLVHHKLLTSMDRNSLGLAA